MKNSSRFIQVVLISLAGFLAFIGPLQAEITLQLEPNTVHMGEAFRLVLSSDGNQDPGLPDLRALKTDFSIIGTERNMSYTVINGQAQSSFQWVIILSPNRLGILNIPAIKIGNQLSKAATIKVLPEQNPGIAPSSPVTNPSSAPKPTPSANQNPVLLKTAVSTSNPYVNQQITYSVKLYNSGRLLDAAYQPPQVENALLISLGDVIRYQTEENGQTYAVEEQRYAIYPQKSGELLIHGPSFAALVYDEEPKRIKVPSELTKVQVKPIPASFKGNYWLVAKQLRLTEEYDKTADTFLQGTALTRIVTIEATDVPAQLLPVLEFKSDAQFSVYPEKPEEENSIQNYELLGRSKIKITYLLKKAGTITIPELSLPWFNSKTGQIEYAKLPAHKLLVEANATHNNPPAEGKTATENRVTDRVVKRSHPIAWIVAAVFALAWLLTMALWFYRPSFFAGHSKRLALKRIKTACLRNNPQDARDALIFWAKLQWPEKNIINLMDLSKLFSDLQFKKQLTLLTQALYGQNRKQNWNGGDFWASLALARKNKSIKKKKKAKLPPINPSI